jgi:assimilatory nitrate reductase catalytic subunit
MPSIKETRSTCPYCGVGCGVVIRSQAGRILDVQGDPRHPANEGRLCSKGRQLHLSASHEVAQASRLMQPQRRLLRHGQLDPISWDSALQVASQRLADIVRTHGPDAVGFYVSGQLLTEDYYVFNKLAKGLLGTNNIDTNSRLCMSSAVAAYKLTLGADAPPACYDDLDHAGCVFMAGSNAAWAHPVLFRRLEDSRTRHPDMKLIVVDPRRTDSASCADLHLAIQPGSDVMLFHGMLHIMLREGWTDPDFIARHTHNFEALKDLVRDCTPERVHAVCGIPLEPLLLATRWFAWGGHDHPGSDARPSDHGATLSLYCQGLNQSSQGTANNACLINLHLATGHIGRPGAGPFSLTGQPNAMGGREVGGLANLLSAHRDLSNPVHRAEVARLWGVNAVPEHPGKTAVEMFQAAADGEIKALWIACTNPAQSMPDQATVRRALERAEWVVVQEAFADTETCAYADLILPATTWGEKDGTVTNSERRITRVRPAIPPPGQTRHDWQIVVGLAQALLAQPDIAQRCAGLRMDYASVQDIWLEHRESTRGRDLDITGMSYAQLESQPLQWPMIEGQAQGTARLYEDGRFATPDGRARFAALPHQPVAESTDSRWPFALTSGRLRDQWHGMSRTGLVPQLFGHVPEPQVQLNPTDMRALQLQEGDLVHVTSRRGSLVVRASSCEDVAARQAFMAMHWGQAYLSGRSHRNTPLTGVNSLTVSTYCPRSKQPELKHAAVKILKADLPWRLVALAWFTRPLAIEQMRRLRAHMQQFEFASCVPFSDPDPQAARQGVLFRAANSEAPCLDAVVALEELMGIPSQGGLRYVDARPVHVRSMQLSATSDGQDSRLDAWMLAGDTRAEAWLTQLLHTSQPVRSLGRRLLMTGLQPPVPLATEGQVVCSCLGVKDQAIQNLLAGTPGNESEQLEHLQAKLKCGTQCGSCVPQLKRMIRLVPQAVSR